MPPVPDSGSDADFFFRRTTTLDALTALSGCDDLVLYCGAGVSIDRTGMSWPALVRAVFNSARANRHDLPKQTGAIAYLLDHAIDPQHSASIVVEAFRSEHQSEDAFLGSKLKDVLYEQSGWNRGLVIRRLAALAVLAAGRGRSVHILTTNYDVHLEQEIAALAADAPSPPVVEVEAPTESPEWVATDVSHGSIRITYLHGRIDQNAQVRGRIVLTEQSYAATRERIRAVLGSAFSRDAGVVVVGASLTDPPLVDALTSSRDAGRARYALLSAPKDFSRIEPFRFPPGESGGTEVTAEDVSAASALRGIHLGLHLLRPLSHAQTAQFIEELRVAVSSAAVTGDPRWYADAAHRLRYSDRLDSWNNAWTGSEVAQKPELVYDRLLRALRSIRTTLDTAGAGRGEGLRLEAWVRRNPTRLNRSLTLWGSTLGPTFDQTVLRRETITPSSTIASIRALLEGRPQLTSLTDLGESPDASRWQTFLSVPIFAVTPVLIDGVPEKPAVPVGVVTLASLRTMSARPGEQQSFFANASNRVLEEVKIRLLASGASLFGVQSQTAAP